jgi:hypothetical protein
MWHKRVTASDTNNQAVVFTPQANYTDLATATGRRILVPTSADRGVSRGQRDGTPTVLNLSFIYNEIYRRPKV